ncbi:hypothetical protein F5I97DRAFT_1889869 [Phlebopus sp. FC_14]|nr:hypothetical protein F5I97DRAFT_1889869 [Phlebopus sp. FC_14]
MSGFAALMALSASQTRESQSAVQSALQQRHRNEEIKRKKQEEADRKQREEEAKLRQKRFEDEKKQRELEAKKEAEMKRMEAEQQRREEEARNALVYGPKKKHGPKWPSSNGSTRDEVRRRRLPSDDEDDSRSGSPAMALTREEKRQRKLDAEMRRTYSVKRSSGSSGYSKAGRRLPGGAIDTTTGLASDSGSGTQSVKARLAALPNTLTKLNVKKRDTRTIDEILQDRAKARENVVLDGDEAREFHDWFGKSKKKDLSLTSTQSSTTLPSAPSSGGNSPMPSSARANSLSATKTSSSTKSSVQPADIKFSAISQIKTVAGSKVSSSSTKGMADTRRPSTTPKAAHSRSPAPPAKSQPSRSSLGTRPTATVPSKKRPRSPSLSLSPPPPKRRGTSPEDSIRSEIWKLFGKDRTSYIARDVLSDDEDMEADASAVMREELRSTRLARHEDDLALEEEKRHEEEKRRRKREREMRERRS